MAVPATWNAATAAVEATSRGNRKPLQKKTGGALSRTQDELPTDYGLVDFGAAEGEVLRRVPEWFSRAWPRLTWCRPG